MNRQPRNFILLFVLAACGGSVDPMPTSQPQSGTATGSGATAPAEPPPSAPNGENAGQTDPEPAVCPAFVSFDIRTNVPAEPLPAETTKLSLEVLMVGPGEGSLTSVVVETANEVAPTVGPPTTTDGGKTWQCEITGLQSGGEYILLPVVNVEQCEGSGLNPSGRKFGGKLTVATE